MENTNNIVNVDNIISEKAVELNMLQTNLPTVVEENMSFSKNEQLLVSHVYQTIKHDIEAVLINFDFSNDCIDYQND